VGLIWPLGKKAARSRTLARLVASPKKLVDTEPKARLSWERPAFDNAQLGVAPCSIRVASTVIGNNLDHSGSGA